MTRRTQTPRAAGFTLIELLVVISIIAVLTGLLLPAVHKIRESAKRAQVNSEINQMSNAAQNFKTRYGDYFPSVMVLREKMDYNLNDPIERDSLNVLRRFFPRTGGGYANGTAVDASPLQGVDWNGNGVIDGNGTSSPAMVLEGDQCLVFFLGGIPNPQANGTFGAGGFSNNPQNPAALPVTARHPSLYEFPANRLKDVHNGSGFPSFIDRWEEKPYAYFHCFGRKGGYYKYAGGSPPVRDCQTITGAGFTPYIDGAGQFINSVGYQIVSAGKDKNFGTGSTGGTRWTPGSFGQGQPDADNLTNFHPGMLLAVD